MVCEVEDYQNSSYCMQKSCISNGINTCSGGNMQLRLFCLLLNRYGPSRRAWLLKLECLDCLWKGSTEEVGHSIQSGNG